MAVYTYILCILSKIAMYLINIRLGLSAITLLQFC